MSDNHGNTVAAWSAVGIAILAFVVSGIALMLYSWLWFWIGAVILVFAPVVGTILARMGHGATR